MDAHASQCNDNHKEGRTDVHANWCDFNDDKVRWMDGCASRCDNDDEEEGGTDVHASQCSKDANDNNDNNKGGRTVTDACQLV